MNREKHYPLLGRLALLCAALIWGGSFVGMKSLMSVFSPQYLLMARFALAVVVMAIVLLPRLGKLTLSYLWRGGVLGVLLFAAYSFQTYGLADTTPGKNAFLTAVYCVLVPFVYWAVDKVRPDRYNISAAVLTIIGIGCVSLDGGLSVGKGDALTLIGGVCLSLHMVALAKLGRGRDPLLITMVQFAGVAICAGVAALCFEQPPVLSALTLSDAGALAYLVVCATCLTLSMQTFGQQHTPPAAAAILMALEAVFGVLISVLAGERPTPTMIVGFVIIFVAVILSETKLSFLHRRHPR